MYQLFVNAGLIPQAFKVAECNKAKLITLARQKSIDKLGKTQSIIAISKANPRINILHAYENLFAFWALE